ncbi:hypothetical protein GGE24_007714 [Bradyrhizobium centrosematis]|nr:hypothetical protein [Bradyrhizobium centrosematis]MCS3778336.1 hypothetical protein [Bradyrhizobium centrosematis]
MANQEQLVDNVFTITLDTMAYRAREPRCYKDCDLRFIAKHRIPAVAWLCGCDAGVPFGLPRLAEPIA